MNHKSSIINQLTLLLDDNKCKNENFKVRAYQNAINAIKEYDDEITTEKDLEKIKGLSKGSIRKKIIELIKTGEISQVKYIDKEINIIQDLTNVYGIGPSKSNELVYKYNISSIEDLKEKSLKDGTLLNDKQKIGLNYYEDLLKRIPRTEMKKHEDYITNFIKKIDINNDLIYEVTGSYRRELQNSGDIDVLCTTKNENTQLFNKIIDSFENETYIKETLAKGEKKFMGICKLSRYKTNRRLDMIYTKKEYYPFALLYFTGSGQFNIEMRNYALSLGYSLSEYGLKKEGKFVDNNGQSFETEKDIFNFLGMKYINPEERKGGIIIENLIKNI